MSDTVDNPNPDKPPVSEVRRVAMAIAAIDNNDILRDDLLDVERYAEQGPAPGRSSCRRVVAELLRLREEAAG